MYIGIDLGTTYSAVSIIDQYGKATILPTPSGERLTPSAVYIGPNGNILVGAEAKEMLQDEPDNVATFFKRYMGDSDYAFFAGDKEYSAADLQAILLTHLRQQAEAVLHQPVTDAVITVPAYFNDLQRNQTVDAGRRAGLNVLRIINEPTSAAICYGLGGGQVTGTRRVMVYDLGGGTFDVTVLEVADGAISVLATGGDHHLGGKDWDDMLIDYISGEFRAEHGVDPREDFEAYSDMLFNVEKLKIQLSSRESASIVVRSGVNRSRVTVTREKFEEITQHLLASTQSKADEVLAEAGLQWADLEGVLLVGGSTKMPMVENWVRRFSGKEPLRGINVDEAVCLGAVLQARIDIESQRVLGIGGGRPAGGLGPGGASGGIMRVRDVMSHSLGAIAVSDDGSRYVNSIIIPRNKPIPIEEMRPFKHHTRAGGPNELEVYLTQGESREVADCVIIGRYVFHDIAHVPSGETIIDISYSYDTNGIVQVSGFQRETMQALVPEKLPVPDDMSWLYGRPQGGTGMLSVVITVDVSYSMMGKPLKKAQDAAREFVHTIDLSHAMVAIHAFSDSVVKHCDLTNDERTLLRAIDNMSLEGANLANPLKQATEILEPQLCCSKPVMIVLTDGMWTSKKHAIKVSDHCREVGIDIIALGFGGADEEFLRRISTISSMTDLEHVVETFGTIAQELNTGGLSLKR